MGCPFALAATKRGRFAIAASDPQSARVTISPPGGTWTGPPSRARRDMARKYVGPIFQNLAIYLNAPARIKLAASPLSSANRKSSMALQIDATFEPHRTSNLVPPWADCKPFDNRLPPQIAILLRSLGASCLGVERRSFITLLGGTAAVWPCCMPRFSMPIPALRRMKWIKFLKLHGF